MGILGERIKQLRNKLTQEELAAILGVERSTLASWEINRREPDITTLCQIADYFQVSIDWLVGRTPEKHPTTSIPTYFHEANSDYHVPVTDKAWGKVIETAQTYGFDPDLVIQLLEMHAKLIASQKNNNCK